VLAVPIRRHQPEQSARIGRTNDRPQRLKDFSARECGECVAHQLDALRHRQQPRDLFII
jgi:hypothetical protein